jgi:hypothetical protein
MNFMKMRFNALALSVVVLCIVAVALAQPTTQPEGGGRGQGRGPRGPREGMPQNVEGAMKGANRAMKQLKSQLADASKRDENLKLVGDMQRNVVIAKNMPIPHDIKEDVQGDARMKLQAEYRADMIAVVRKLLDVEDALMTGKTDDAAKALDDVQKMRVAAHEKLGVHDEDDR